MVLFFFVISFLTIQINAADTQSIIAYEYGIAKNQGKKSFMEDRIVLETENKYPVVGVLDGHGGSFTVDKVLEALHEHATETPIIAPTENSITNFFHSTNNTIKELSTNDALKQNSGSTASVAFVHDADFYCAQVGDSAIIDHEGKLVLPAHGLNNTEERVRAGEHNFFQTFDGERFGGQLLMTRAFGDFNVTQNGLIAKPDIKKIQLKPTEFLIFATDGVSEELSSKTIAKYVHLRIKEQIELSRIAKELIILASVNTMYVTEKIDWIEKIKQCSDQILDTHYEFRNMQKRAHDNQAVVIVRRKS